MLDNLNRPLFIAALIAWLLVVLVEVGSSWLPVPALTLRELTESVERQHLDNPPSADDLAAMMRAHNEKPPRPGFAITSLVAFDGMAFLGFFWMGAGLVISRRLVGRVQGVISLLASLLVIIGGIIVAIVLLVLLFVMLGLFLAVPFGTLAYLAIWGFFDRGPAAFTLGLLLTLKIVAAVLLVLAQRDFLKNKGLVALLLVSLLLTLLTSFLHGFPPGILVSITDVIAALVILVVAIIWAILVLISSIIATIKAIPPEKTST